MKDFEKIHECGYLIERVHIVRATILEALEFKNVLDDDINEGNHNIIIDLSKCEFLDSTFIGVLVVTWKKLKNVGGRLKLVKPGYFAKSVFHLTGAIEIFETYSSIEEALSSFLTPIEEYDHKSGSQRKQA